MAFHGASLRAEGVSEQVLEDASNLKEELHLSEVEWALLDLALTARSDPSTIDDSEIENLHQQGVTDAQLVETIEVMAFAHTFNTLAHVLGLEPD